MDAVEAAGVDVSMDGRGRWMDNRFIERLWRSAKQEDIYVQDYGDGLTAQRGLARWFGGYNTERPHQALEYATPGGPKVGVHISLKISSTVSGCLCQCPLPAQF